MNGRLYDPYVGRMLSADRYVEDATSSLAYNRYSYVGNNPLKYTDPSGWVRYSFARETHLSREDMISGSSGSGMYMGNSTWSELTGGNMLTSWGTTMLSGIHYAPSQQYYINPLTGSYMFGNQVIDKKDYLIGMNKNTGYWSKSVVTKAYAVPDKEATDGFGAVFVEQTDYYYNTLDNATAQNGGGGDGGLGNWLSGFDIAAGAYSEYGHNHTRYKTTKGIEKNIYKANGQVRSARAAQFARASNLVKGIAFVGSAVSTTYSGYKVYNQIQTGGLQNVNGWDATDAGVGLLGIGATGAVYFGLISNPVGWSIGTGVLIYGGARFVYDLYNKK